MGAELSYWHVKLQDIPILELPTDRSRLAVQTYNGAYQSTEISVSLLEALRQLNHREGVALTMTLLAVFYTLLYRYKGQEDIAIGVPLANRRQPAVKALIGAFVNTLALCRPFGQSDFS